jgi:hypothetical protein
METDKVKIYRAKYYKEEYRSKKGYLRFVYHNHKRREMARSGTNIPYTAEDLFEWATSQKEFHRLFARWEALNFKLWENPSFDRIDDYKGYSLGNLQFTTGAQNRARFWNDMKNGINTKQCKAVIATCVATGKKLTFYSIKQAARFVGSCSGNICKCIASPNKTAKGYSWRTA